MSERICATPALLPPTPEHDAWWAFVGRPRPVLSPIQQKAVVAAASNLGDLEFLQLSFNLDEDDVRLISKLKCLKTLSLSVRQLTADATAAFQALERLETLVVNVDPSAPVPIDALAQLKVLTHLESLTINRAIRAEDIERLKTALPHVAVSAYVPTP